MSDRGTCLLLLLSVVSLPLKAPPPSSHLLVFLRRHSLVRLVQGRVKVVLCDSERAVLRHKKQAAKLGHNLACARGRETCVSVGQPRSRFQLGEGRRLLIGSPSRS